MIQEQNSLQEDKHQLCGSVCVCVCVCVYPQLCDSV